MDLEKIDYKSDFIDIAEIIESVIKNNRERLSNMRLSNNEKYIVKYYYINHPIISFSIFLKATFLFKSVVKSIRCK